MIVITIFETYDSHMSFLESYELQILFKLIAAYVIV
jgi:hypothetical protein